MPKLTDQPALLTPDKLDLIHVVDVSDISSGAAGTSKKVALENIPSAVAAEIKTAYESNADTNALTDAEKTIIGNTSGTNTGDQDLSGKQDVLSEGAFVDGDKTKLDAIEDGADVTDATNVAAAGAVMIDPTPINNQIDNYTIALSDINRLVRMDKATAVVVTVPTDTSLDFPIGAEIAFEQAGVGTLSIAGEDGTVLLHHSSVSLNFNTQYSTGAIKKVDVNTWLVAGDLI